MLSTTCRSTQRRYLYSADCCFSVWFLYPAVVLAAICYNGGARASMTGNILSGHIYRAALKGK